MTDLKPCPFCGSEMEIPARGPVDSWKIRHPRKDGCLLDQMIIYEHDEEGFARRVDGWNHRATPHDSIPAEKVRELVELWKSDIGMLSTPVAMVVNRCRLELADLLDRCEEVDRD